ncbi:hypothetical protein EAF00_006784 [Botryotinia globosa]|nr:hypothetical protein EAF00_006784 [Botryotinia globosa]
MAKQIAEIADEVMANLPRSDQPSKGRLMILGAVFDLPEILENGLKNHKKSMRGYKSFTRKRHRIRFTRYGQTPVEDMMYWVNIRNGSSQQLEGRLEVENFLLNHEKSRTHFLNQLETHLSTGAHPDPLRALKILYRASNELPISAKIFEYRIKAVGLDELAQVLDLMDEETFDEEMVAGVVRNDSCETVKNVFEFKEVSSITEQIVGSALESIDSKTLAYLIKQFGHDVLTREIVINTKPRSHEVWKVILHLKGIQFVNQEVLDSLFHASVDIKAVTFVLDSCGTEMIRSSHVESVAGFLFQGFATLNAILRARGSLDGLITEEAVFKAFRTMNFDVAAVLLENAEDRPSLLTKRVKEVAKLSGPTGMLFLPSSRRSDQSEFYPDWPNFRSF